MSDRFDASDLFDENTPAPVVDAPVGRPEKVDIAAYIEDLEDRCADDPGYVAEDAQLETLARMMLRETANWMRVEAMLKRRKLLASVKPALRRKCTELARSGQLVTIKRAVKAILPDAPVTADVRVPHGWEMLADEQVIEGEMPHALRRLVERRRGDNIEVMRVPLAHGQVVVTAVQIDEQTGDAYLEVAWRKQGRWRSTVVPRSQLSTASGLAGCLGGKGFFPLHAHNARDMTEYLIDFEAANADALPKRNVSTQMGWHGKGFLLGSEYHGDGTTVGFLAPDDGDRQLSDAFESATGSVSGWLNSISGIQKYPRAEIALYASLAAPLLEVLQAPNFIMEWCGQTSTGKSTALSVAASVWGDPSPRAPNSVIGTWATTKVAIERRMSTLNGLPTILDETKMARTFAGGRTIIPSVMYAAINGQSDSRGSIKGLSRNRSWRTVMLSTGEQRMVDFDKSGGTAARVLTLWGSPFGGHAPKIVRALESGLSGNHGVAGRHFINWILNNRSQWPHWRVELDESFDELLPLVTGVGNDAGVSGRLARCLAVLEVASQIAHRCFDFPWELQPLCRGDLLESIGIEGRTAKRHVEALELVGSIIAARSSALQNSPDADKEPHAGWIGYMPDSTSSRPWPFIGLHSAWLKRELQGQGFEPNAIIRQWKDAGWLSCDTESRATRRISIDRGNRVSMICITREALEMSGFGDDKTATRELFDRPAGEND